MRLATRPGLSRSAATEERRVFRVTGVVQGVGFRPFVHRLATELGLSGFVGNDALAVFAEVQGSPSALAEFNRRLPLEAPPLALVVTVDAYPIAPTTDPGAGFTVVASRGGAGTARTLVPPDVATCQACVTELFDTGDRRYRHPFITCTDCGPRFTIIQDLPYDRPATTMAGFAMCAACAREYEDPADRRFHAQPVACPDCGPMLWFEHGETRVEGADAALVAAQQALREGMIVAVKGVGGFHLACRADDPTAIARLRQRKARDEKPFALLARDLAAARRLVRIEVDEQAVLTCAARPIVLMQRRDDAPVADSVAPGNPLLGVMLPSSPLHHLLLAQVPGAEFDPMDVLVMTSANISDEPLCFDDVDAASRLPALADAVLTHDRPIHVPCDDSVVRVVDGQELPIRRSRGYAPLPVRLVPGLPATLAVGAELKNTCCLIDGANAFCSAHIGDMGSLDTARAFERAVAQLTTLHRVQAEVFAADAHPSYLTRSWAERHSGGPGEPVLCLVQHHHAHVASLLAEHGRIGHPVIGVAFDGTGYGDDGTIWGGEFLLLGDDTTRYRRAGHLMTVDLPGGDAAVRNPCRMALAYLDAAGVAWDDGLAPVDASTPAERAAVRAQLDSGGGTVKCSSMGRLFDAVASLLDVRHRIGYEAQAAIQLEVLAASGERDGGAPELRFGLDEDGVLDYRPVVRGLVDGMRAGVSPARLAYAFHAAVTEAVAGCVTQIADDSGVRVAGLTGGVFQNVLLLRACRDRLAAAGLEVLVHRLVPPNDGGIALGQAVVAAHRAMSAASTPDTGEKDTP
ncbi:MAG: (NiFe) hydrogenase maturation protein HypF [Pseudonocardiales bacterium]|nr:(NiFe) hydrogenase maturation protein HypF [Pseudonocardiales bacterium]